MFRRLASVLTGGMTAERLASLERSVRKLSDADREGLQSLDQRIAELSRIVSDQPTGKDLRELRQTLRGLTDRQPDRRLLEAIEQIASSGRPVLVGPWTGEVGFELLYWIPFVRWVRAQWDLGPAREVIVSRGGVASWYGGAAGTYVDIFDCFSTDAFRAAVADEKRKRRRPGAFEEQVIAEVVRRQRLGDVDMLHPGLMYRLFDAFWTDDAGYSRVDQFTRHALLTPPEAPAGLPAEYAAVRFYFNECFPATPENRAFARGVVTTLAERTPVVVLNPGFSVDDHTDWIPDIAGRVIRIDDRVTPTTNLAVQSAVVGAARAFVGTYGGYSYLAPLYRVPALAFYSKPSFKLHHLYAAQRAFSAIGAAPVIPIDVAHAAVVQLALGTVVPA